MGSIRDLTAGAVLGRYELVLRVASGGMGEVWAARLKGSRGFQKLVAIKTLLAELSHNPSFEQMFLDEAKLASRIRHPNVVQVIDLGDEDQVLFQVMEWVAGESLWSMMRASAKRGDKAIPLPVAAGIVCQVAAGLHAAHELKNPDGTSIGLVHRDVSPQNVLVTPQGLVKVVDFGVAKFAGRGVAATQFGELRGKVPFMAPEHVRGQELDRRADVFALGVLFYQMVSGVHPFLGDTDQITLARISSALPVAPLHELDPGISAELSAVVAAALEKDPAARVASAALFRQMIERAVPGAGRPSAQEDIGDFCRTLGRGRFEERERELKSALRRLDDPSSTERSSAAIPIAGLDLPRDALQSEPATPPGTASSPPPEELTIPMVEPVLGRRGRMAAGAVAVLLAGGTILGLALRTGPARPGPAASAIPAASAAPALPASAATEPPAASASAPPSASAPASASATPIGTEPKRTGKMPRRPDKPAEFKPGGL